MNVLKWLKMLLMGLLLIFVLGNGYSSPSPQTAVARVVWIKGDSFKAISQDKQERKLEKTSVIYLHDKLITNNNTQAEVVFTDNTLITFQVNTNFSVDDYSFKPGNKSGSVGKSVMGVLEGGFRTITGLIAKNNPPDYTVKTPVATIGVRGTDYSVQLKNGELFIGYKTGKPCVTSNKKELCLDANTPYAKVASATSSPEGLKERPEALGEEDLDIIPAKIAGFGSIGKGGTVTSFCIGQ